MIRNLRLCRSSDTSRVTHVEHSGGLTFCGKDAGWWPGLTYTDRAGAMAAVTCKRCRRSLVAAQTRGDI